MDYASDQDPLGYMTSNYRSPYLAESQFDMKRRFFLRGRHASKPWQRALVLLMLYVPIGLFVIVALAELRRRL